MSYIKQIFDLQVSQTPPSRNNVIVQTYWDVGQEVDNRFLRKEVQEFCGQFPIFRYQELDKDQFASLKNITNGHSGSGTFVDIKKLIRNIRPMASLINTFIDTISLPTRGHNPNNLYSGGSI